MSNELLDNIEKLHTTELGVERVKKNLSVETSDVVESCRQWVLSADNIFRKGKNWYVHYDDFIVTINAHSYTIITAHKVKENKNIIN